MHPASSAAHSEPTSAGIAGAANRPAPSPACPQEARASVASRLASVGNNPGQALGLPPTAPPEVSGAPAASDEGKNRGKPLPATAGKGGPEAQHPSYLQARGPLALRIVW